MLGWVTRFHFTFESVLPVHAVGLQPCKDGSWKTDSSKWPDQNQASTLRSLLSCKALFVSNWAPQCFLYLCQSHGHMWILFCLGFYGWPWKWRFFTAFHILTRSRQAVKAVSKFLWLHICLKSGKKILEVDYKWLQANKYPSANCHVFKKFILNLL